MGPVFPDKRPTRPASSRHDHRQALGIAAMYGGHTWLISVEQHSLSNEVCSDAKVLFCHRD
jgi:hypothetical protein